MSSSEERGGEGRGEAGQEAEEGSVRLTNAAAADAAESAGVGLGNDKSGVAAGGGGGVINAGVGVGQSISSSAALVQSGLGAVGGKDLQITAAKNVIREVRRAEVTWLRRVAFARR